MPCFVIFFAVSAVQKLLKSVKIWQSCSQMYTATFYEPRRKCMFWFFQVRCAHKSGHVLNFIIVACRISSRLKWYKNYKNRLRLAKVIVKNIMSRFLWFSVYNWNCTHWAYDRTSGVLLAERLCSLGDYSLGVKHIGKPDAAAIK